MKSTVFRILLILALIGLGQRVNAEDASSDGEIERPRIGLVLGGGGARGAAHIGVLRELERLRVPIDAIAGTSMGAVVGSLYASGKTPDELEDLVRSINWADAFVDTSPRRDLSFRRKQDDAAFPVKLELGVKDGEVQLPKGLIQGQKLQLILRDQLLHVSNLNDFDQLPIPFRAVASDIETGAAYVMSSGDLALAARASMSAPGLFSPVIVDGKTLVDGGLVGNVPVSVIQDMGVDIVIAVDVEFPLYPPEQLQSALEITEQMLTILIRKETRRQLAGLKEGDILIRPDLGNYGSTNFSQISETIAPGAAATVAKTAELQSLSLSEEQYAAHKARRVVPSLDSDIIEFVRVIDGGLLSKKVLHARLATEPGDQIDTTELAKDAERLYGLNVFESVGYRIVSDGEQTGVEFETRDKSWGPDFLKFGVSLEEDFEGSTAFNLATRLTITGINALGAEWRNDLQIGTEPRLESEFYQPLSFDSRYFVAPHLSLEQRNLKAFANDLSIARFRVSEAEFGVDAGRELGRWGEFRLGTFRGVGDVRVKVGDPSLTNFSFETGGVFARLSVDTLDDAQLPKVGARANVQWLMSRPDLGADSHFDSFQSTFDKVWSWGRDDRNTAQFGIEYSTTVRSDGRVQDYFPLGGFLRMSGLERGEIIGPHAGLARLVYYRQLGDASGFFDMPVYLGSSLEAGNVWQNRADISVRSMIINGSLFAGVDTYIGPLFFAAGFSEEGDTGFYLFLGNPRY